MLEVWGPFAEVRNIRKSRMEGDRMEAKFGVGHVKSQVPGSRYVEWLSDAAASSQTCDRKSLCGDTGVCIPGSPGTRSNVSGLAPAQE